MNSSSVSLFFLAVTLLVASTMGKKLLFVMTNADRMGTHAPTGQYLPEFAHPYNILSKQHEIVFASPNGGPVPIDPSSREGFKDDAECNAFLVNEPAMTALNNSLRLEDLKASDFALVFFPGGHGPMVDLTDCRPAAELTRDVYEAGGLVSAVCHGVGGLLNVKLSDGSLLIKGKKVTGFSDAEEEAIGLSSKVPYLLETELKKSGAVYEKAAENWGVKVVVDGRLVTGQNPASSMQLGETLSKMLT